MAPFQGQAAAGDAVAQLEILVRTAVFKSANALVGWMLQQAADRTDAAYQPRPGEVRKERQTMGVQGIFGSFPLARDYYYHPGKKQGHYPADDALGLEVSYTPALAKLICLEGADEPTYLQAERAGWVLAALIGKDHPDYKARQRRWAKRLLKDKVEVLIKETRQEGAGQPQSAAVEEALGYFVRNIPRMQ